MNRAFAFCVYCGLLATLPLLLGCAQATVANPDGSLPDRETWEVFSIDGVPVGYGRTTISHPAHGDGRVLQIDNLTRLSVKRFNEPVQQQMRFRTVGSLDGKLIELESEIEMGGQPLRTTGRVRGAQLEMELGSQGKLTKAAIPWSEDYGGFYAVEQSLLRRPMQPGQRRTLRALVAGFNQVATVELTAGKCESTRLPAGTRELLRIESASRFDDGQRMESVLWMDRDGEVLKTRSEAMKLESVRATKEEALRQAGGGQLVDIGREMIVKTDRPLPRPHQSRRAVYRVELADGDPAAVFPTGPSQQVRATGAHTAEIVVQAIRPDGSTAKGDGAGDAKDNTSAAGDDRPTDKDRQPNNFIQSDDARVVALARQAAGGERDPWALAVRLERFVHDYVTTKDFSQSLATAAEVARQPVGDCTEHAMLLAALARASGLPARVAIGLVYMEGAQAFGYHMWTEVFIDGRWVAIDGTLGRGGIGAAHLKLADSSLHGVTAYSAFLPVVEVVGRLKIAIGEVEY